MGYDSILLGFVVNCDCSTTILITTLYMGSLVLTQIYTQLSWVLDHVQAQCAIQERWVCFELLQGSESWRRGLISKRQKIGISSAECRRLGTQFLESPRPAGASSG
jgi:hypothetical protein